ncbi:MFS transporter [Rhodococcus erythropolis]
MSKPAPSTRPDGLVGVLAFIGIVAALMQTLVVPLIAELPSLLDSTASNASWAITATLLSSAVSTPVTGRLGDLYGKRRMMLICTTPLFLGSVVCALASSVLPMIVGRTLQGLGIGIIPLGISALRDLLPPERLHSAIALMSSSMGIGGALGLPVAAVVAENTSWRVLFWGAAVLSMLIAVLLWLFVPATAVSGARGRLDAIGAVGLGVGLVCLLLPISKGADWGWTSATTLGVFTAAVVTLAVWVWWELRVRGALVDLRINAGRQVLVTNTASMVVGFAMYAQSLIIPQLLQLPESTGYGLGQSMLAMGLWMAPSGLMMMVVAPFGARLSSTRGPRITLLTGCIVIAFGYGSAVFLMGSTWGLMLGTCICGSGIGLAYGAMPMLIMSAVPLSSTASANSVNALMRSIGTSISAAVVGVVLAQMSIRMSAHAAPTEGGFQTALLIGCGAAILAAAAVLAIPSARWRSAVEKPTAVNV